VKAGEVHAIMGPNGPAKARLHRFLQAVKIYCDRRRSGLSRKEPPRNGNPRKRAQEGVFLAFQYPVEIPGVSTINFMKTALNKIREHRGQPTLDAVSFLQLMKEKMKLVEIDQALLNRALNEGFSGGEKKRNEIFQMAMLEPKLAILDETDSGLDIDCVADRSPRRQQAALKQQRDHRRNTLSKIAGTHHSRLCARVIQREDREVRDERACLELEAKGYDWIKDELALA